MAARTGDSKIRSALPIPMVTASSDARRMAKLRDDQRRSTLVVEYCPRPAEPERYPFAAIGMSGYVPISMRGRGR